MSIPDGTRVRIPVTFDGRDRHQQVQIHVVAPACNIETAGKRELPGDRRTTQQRTHEDGNQSPHNPLPFSSVVGE